MTDEVHFMMESHAICLLYLWSVSVLSRHNHPLLAC